MTKSEVSFRLITLTEEILNGKPYFFKMKTLLKVKYKTKTLNFSNFEFYVFMTLLSVVMTGGGGVQRDGRQISLKIFSKENFS